MIEAYVRITADTGEAELPIGAIVLVDSFDRAYVPGFGLEQQVVGVFTLLPDGRRVHLGWNRFAAATPEEAKRYRAEQKRLRSRARRDLPV